jgi:hypothetical protein
MNLIAIRALIFGLLLLAFFAGLMQFDYAVAVMIALIIRHRDDPGGLRAPIRSYRL